MHWHGIELPPEAMPGSKARIVSRLDQAPGLDFSPSALADCARPPARVSSFTHCMPLRSRAVDKTQAYAGVRGRAVALQRAIRPPSMLVASSVVPAKAPGGRDRRGSILLGPEEDHWKLLRAGGRRLEVVRPQRCAEGTPGDRWFVACCPGPLGASGTSASKCLGWAFGLGQAGLRR